MDAARMPHQVDLEEYLAGLALVEAARPAGLRALARVLDPVDPPADLADVRGRTAGGNGGPRIERHIRPAVLTPPIARLASYGRALYGPTWIMRLAEDLGEPERTVRRWTLGRGQPTEGVLAWARGEVIRQIARLQASLAYTPVRAPALTVTRQSRALASRRRPQLSDAPLIGAGDAVSEAVASPVDLGPGTVEVT